MHENRKSQKTVWLALVVALVFALATEVPAAVPQLINYQGRLTNSVGAPLDTTVELTFTIYSDSTGSIDLWTETHSGVVVQDGLFQVLLGSVDPIIYKVFEDGSRRWLGIQMKGSPAASTLIPIVSVAYSYHSRSADTADYAATGGSSGWTDDGTTVSLSTIGDSVGIGTTNPAFRLDVAGGLRAKDSVQTNKLVLGKASTTTGALNLYSSLTSLPIVQLSGSSTGGTVQVRDEAGNSSAYLKSSTEPGGLLSIARNAAGTSGFYVDGNTLGTEEPKVSVLGSSRSAIFDMSESGDSSVMLPSSSISSVEIKNEAGIANTRRSTGSVTLDNTVKTILSRKCVFPSSGYALVIGTLYYDFWHYAGTGDQFQFGVSDVAGSFPSDQDFLRDYSANWSTFNYQDFVTVQGYFSVDAGIQTFYLLGQAVATGNPWVGDAHLSVLFFPTNYFALKGQDNSNNPEQAEIDKRIEARVAAETELLRKEFEAKLKAIEEEMKKQLDSGGK
jgi:hypothetical protein